MTSFELPADSQESHALESLLPGDHIALEFDDEIIIAHCTRATPDGMTPNGDMTWTKQFEILHTIPKESEP